MALSKDKKQEVVNETLELLTSSKLTVLAEYAGTSVKGMQNLRREAKGSGSTIRVIKNRLFQKALEANDKFIDIDKTKLVGQLLYAFNDSDELAPAQVLADFAKNNPNIKFVGGINEDGSFIKATDIKALASLPSKDQLRGQLINTLQAPFGGFVSVAGGNLRELLSLLNNQAKSLS